MMIDVVIHNVDEIKLLCSLHEMMIIYVKEVTLYIFIYIYFLKFSDDFDQSMHTSKATVSLLNLKRCLANI